MDSALGIDEVRRFGGRGSAHGAEDTELGAFVLCNMSHLATWRGQARVGIDHAIAAQGWASQTDDLQLQAYAAHPLARRVHNLNPRHPSHASTHHAPRYPDELQPSTLDHKPAAPPHPH